MGQSSTSRFQVASVAATGWSGKTLALQRPQRGSSRTRLRGMRLMAPQLEQEYSTRSSSIADLVTIAAGRARPSAYLLQRRRIDAIAFPCGIRTVLEDVPEVPTAAAAVHLDALHPVARVALGGAGARAGGAREARPPGAAVELVLGAEELGATASAEEAPRLVVVPEGAGEGALGAFLTEHAVRSEERRVGKECRYRWGSEGKKKRTKTLVT